MNFPLVTWQVTAPAFTVTNAIGTASVASSTGYYGFGVSSTTAPYPADTDTVAGYLATEITAAATSAPLSLGIIATATFNILNSTSPSLSPLTMTLTTASASAITLVFASLEDAAVYGFSSTTVNIASGFQTTITTFNVGGVWAPSGVSGDVVRTTRQRAASSSSEMSGLSTDVVNWGEVADIEVRSTLFPVANAFTWYATQAIYAQKAQRDVDDPNNICEKMLAAAATGVTFRVYEQLATLSGYTATSYLIAKMPGISSKSAAADFLQADDAPRLWSTTGIFFRGET